MTILITCRDRQYIGYQKPDDNDIYNEDIDIFNHVVYMNV